MPFARFSSSSTSRILSNWITSEWPWPVLVDPAFLLYMECKCIEKRRKISAYAMPTPSGSDAVIEHWTQCRQRSCRDAMHWGASVDARLGKSCPGRNARFAGKEQLQNERSIAVCRARVSKTVSKSTHPTASGPPRSSGDLEAGLEKNIPARMPPAGSLLRSTVNSPPSSESDRRPLPSGSKPDPETSSGWHCEGLLESVAR